MDGDVQAGEAHERPHLERGLRAARADLPGRPPRRAAQLREPGRARGDAASAALRGGVRPLDGLRGVLAQPDQGGAGTRALRPRGVAAGLERTGRIVTAAALLFTVAIGAFATSQIIFIKEVGVGTALAVLIDATIIRALLVPSLMVLLGRWNWWAPRPLRRLHARLAVTET